jgi:hypothetical protein
MRLKKTQLCVVDKEFMTAKRTVSDNVADPLVPHHVSFILSAEYADGNYSRLRRTQKHFLRSLTNPETARNALSLHNEHNSVNHSHSPFDWSVTHVAV